MKQQAYTFTFDQWCSSPIIYADSQDQAKEILAAHLEELMRNYFCSRIVPLTEEQVKYFDSRCRWLKECPLVVKDNLDRTFPEWKIEKKDV